jgi:hypothetical protein
MKIATALRWILSSSSAFCTATARVGSESRDGQYSSALDSIGISTEKL